MSETIKKTESSGQTPKQVSGFNLGIMMTFVLAMALFHPGYRRLRDTIA